MRTMKGNVIYKYELDLMRNEIMMPVGSEILSAGLDPHNSLCVWAKVPIEIEITEDREIQHVGDATEKHVVYVCGTGWSIGNTPCFFIATVKQDGYMWHILEARDGR